MNCRACPYYNDGMCNGECDDWTDRQRQFIDKEVDDNGEQQAEGRAL